MYVSGSSDTARPAVLSIAAEIRVAVDASAARRVSPAAAPGRCARAVSRRRDAVHHLGTLDPLGMAGRRAVVDETVGVDQDK